MQPVHNFYTSEQEYAFSAAIRFIREKKGREKRVISKMPVHGSLYRFSKRPIGSELIPVSVSQSAGIDVCLTRWIGSKSITGLPFSCSSTAPIVTSGLKETI